MCFCAHGPGGCAGPGGVQGGEALSRSAGQLWSIWQRPELLFDDAGGASVSIPAPPLHQPSACVSEAAQAATQGVQEARAQLQGSCRAHSEARHAAQRQAATMARREQEHGLPPGPPLLRAAPPGVAGEPLAEVPRPSPPSLHWLPLPPADVLQGVLDEFDPLFGLGDFHPPQQLVRLAVSALPPRAPSRPARATRAAAAVPAPAPAAADPTGALQRQRPSAATGQGGCALARGRHAGGVLGRPAWRGAPNRLVLCSG